MSNSPQSNNIIVAHHWCLWSVRVMVTGDMAISCHHWSTTHISYSWYSKAHWLATRLPKQTKTHYILGSNVAPETSALSNTTEFVVVQPDMAPSELSVSENNTQGGNTCFISGNTSTSIWWADLGEIYPIIYVEIKSCNITGEISLSWISRYSPCRLFKTSLHRC